MVRGLLLVGILVATSAIPLGAECSRKCDKTAAACLDTCEATHGSDAAARVQCKVKCAEARQSCDKACK